MLLFKRRDVDRYTDSLAAYLPGGDLFTSRSIKNSNFRKLLRGMATELFRANGALRDYNCEVLPDETVKLIPEYERMLGIPDDCFTGTGTFDERRRDILVKLASLGVQTTQDFVDLAAIFGITVTITPGATPEPFPLGFPILFFPTAQDARFTIIVNITVPLESTFPYSFPMPFGTSEVGIIRCIFEKLKPANSQLIIRQVA